MRLVGAESGTVGVADARDGKVAIDGYVRHGEYVDVYGAAGRVGAELADERAERPLFAEIDDQTQRYVEYGEEEIAQRQVGYEYVDELDLRFAAPEKHVDEQRIARERNEHEQ